VATFTDKRGREWEVTLTAGHLKRIKKTAGVDLRDALKEPPNGFTEALDDPERMLELFWALCGRGSPVPRDEFEDLFDRDTTVAAAAAVWEATWDFFRGRKAGAEARQTLLAAVDKVEDATAAIMVKATDRVRNGPTSSGSVNGSAESPASTTAPSPSPS
jgi:hypothetical protein